MTVNSVERQLEIEQILLAPVYAQAKILHNQLGYDPVIYPPGEPAKKSKKTELEIIVDFDVQDREQMTMRYMFETAAIFTITFSVPQPTPKPKNIIQIIKKSLSSLQDFYSRDFCNDVEQMSFESVRWTYSLDSPSRAEYILTIDLKFKDYVTEDTA